MSSESPTNNFTSFAVAGTGGVGDYIVRALVAAGAKVIILTRKSASNDKKPPAGIDTAAIFTVDYEDKPSVTRLLREQHVDVVVSALPEPRGLAVQYPLADAAKDAGVKLFVPSEFGMPTAGANARKKDNTFAVKDAFAGYLKTIGLPYARFFVGVFMEYLPWLVAYESNGKINIAGKGETAFSVTHQDDIGGFVAHVLTTLPPSELENKQFRIQGQRVTLLELAQILGKEVSFVDQVPGSTDSEIQFRNLLQSNIASGHVSTGWDRGAMTEGKDKAGSSNKLWKGHQWKKIEESIKL